MNNNLSTALDYLINNKWAVVPMKLTYEGNNTTKATKQPTIRWREFTDRLPTVEEVTQWWTQNPNADIGIITGPISNLAVLDLDIGYDKEKIKELNIPETLSVKTPSGGMHMYFKYPTGNTIRSRTDLFSNDSHIDVRAEGGLVVAPPSLYPNGVPYQWDNGGTAIADLPSNLISLFVNFKEAKSSQQPMSFNFEAVSEGSRNNTAAINTGKIVKIIPQTEWRTTGWNILQEWNRKNLPPLSEHELRVTFESICNSEARSGASALKEKEPDVAITDSISLKELLNKDFPLIDYVIHQFFETGTINMISAAPHQYKSWVVHHMALCVASGENVFGKFPVKKQNVMIINEEDSERSMKNRSGKLIGQKDSDLNVYFHVEKGFKLSDAFIKRILDEAKRKNIGFIIFDSLRSIHKAEENSSKEMQEVFDFLKEFNKNNITVLFTHHNRKKQRGFGDSNELADKEDARGSSSIVAAIHGQISCEPKETDEGNKILIIQQHKLKCDVSMSPFKVKIIEENGNMSFEYDGDYDSKIENRTSVATQVLNYLEFNDWQSVKDLIKAKIASDRPIRDALKHLSANHLVMAKTRKELASEGATIQTNGSGSEILYCSVTKKPSTELPGY